MSCLRGSSANPFTTLIMHITDINISNCRRRRQIWNIRVYAVLAFELNNAIPHLAVQRLDAEADNIARLNIGQRHIVAVIFNLNADSVHQNPTDSRFKQSNITILYEMFK